MVFISYGHEDISSAVRLYQDLERAGLTPWLDKEKLLPGQKWEPAIKKAIRDSRYFIALLSSNSVSRKGFVNKEITEALELLDEYPESDVFLIPVRLDECQPSHQKLSDLHWVDMFPSWEKGLAKILGSLPAAAGKNISLRSAPISLSSEDVMGMLIEHNYYHVTLNPHGEGVSHQYQQEHNGKVVRDKTTGLCWNRFGSQSPLTFDEAKEYVERLNRNRYCDFNDWRLPTLEEAMSLMEPVKSDSDSGYYISPLFRNVAWVWTSDLTDGSKGVWIAFFNSGACASVYRYGTKYFVLPVR
jgi:hypothetical protein